MLYELFCWGYNCSLWVEAKGDDRNYDLFYVFCCTPDIKKRYKKIGSCRLIRGVIMMWTFD